MSEIYATVTKPIEIIENFNWKIECQLDLAFGRICNCKASWYKAIILNLLPF